MDKEIYKTNLQLNLKVLLMNEITKKSITKIKKYI